MMSKVLDWAYDNAEFLFPMFMGLFLFVILIFIVCCAIEPSVYERHQVVHIGQTISTGGIGAVLQTEIKLDNGYRGFTYTDWINGVSVGDYICIDESANIKKDGCK